MIKEHLLDTCGLMCPEPIMLLHRKVKEMQGGERVKVVATDSTTQVDIPKFCHFLNYELIHQERQANQFIYIIKKNY